MKLNCRWIQQMLAVVTLTGVTGCGGFSGTKSVSPAGFFLPGLLKAQPQAVPTFPESPVSEPPADLQAIQAQ